MPSEPTPLHSPPAFEPAPPQEAAAEPVVAAAPPETAFEPLMAAPAQEVAAEPVIAAPAQEVAAEPVMAAAPQELASEPVMAPPPSMPQAFDAPSAQSIPGISLDDDPFEEPATGGALSGMFEQLDAQAEEESLQGVPLAQVASIEEPQDEPRTLISLQGKMTRAMVHSLLSLNMRPDFDEITPSLATFDRLQEGEHAFIRFSFRPAPSDTRSHLQEMLNMIVGGESMSEVRNPSSNTRLRRWVNYGMGMLSFAASQDKKKQMPTSPRKGYRPDKQKPVYQRSEEEQSARKFAQEKVQAGAYYDCQPYIGVIGPQERQQELSELAQMIAEEFTASYSNVATGQGWAWEQTEPVDAAAGLMNVRQDYTNIVGPHELGEMIKLPDSQTNATGSVRIDYGKMVVRPHAPIVIPDPLNPPPGIVPIGEIDVDTSRQKAIGMPIEGFFTHAYVCGTTGSGKSTLLEWLMYGLAKQGQSIFCVDPHGELVDHTLDNILAFAPERADDILVLDFGDTEHPIAFNPLSISSQAEIEGTVNAVKDMILKMLNLSPDSAPRAVNYTEQAVWALCEANLRGLGSHSNLHLSLLQVPLFFTDQDFRHTVMEFCTNLAIRETFDPEGPFEKMGERQQLDHVMPILRTFASLSTKDSFGNVFGQSESKIDFAKWVREKKIVMMKLPAIAGGDSAVAKFIGAMVTPMLIGSLPKWAHDKELSAYLVIDEFQNYATESFKDLLAQTRKYGLYAIAANQVPQDLPQDVLRGIQSNTQSKFCFRLDAQASRMIADFIASGSKYPTTDDIISMDNYWAWANVKMGQEQSGPFVIKGLAPPLSDGYKMPEDWRASGKANLEQLKPHVTESSRLSLSVPRDQAWQAREHHVRNAMAVLQKKIEDRALQGGYEGGSLRPEEETWQSGDWDWDT